jgi:hypothetical protein
MARRVLSRQLEQLEDRSTPAVAYALQSNALVAFDTSNPAAALPSIAITNIAAGQTLVGIDFRPQNGMLYGLGYNSGAGVVQLYAISHRTGAATAIGGPIGGVIGNHFGFDFNPTLDRIRVVNDAGQNFRIDPNTGALAGGAFDGNINGAVLGLDAIAYTNSQPNASVTTLYGLNATTNQLVIQSDPNTGLTTSALTVTLNGAVLDFTAINGFDIPTGVNVSGNNQPATGSAFASLTVGGTTGLYAINLANAQATFLGNIGAGNINTPGLAIQSDLSSTGASTIPLGAAPGIALSADGTLLLRTFGGPTVSQAITSVAPGDILVGIDFRPATGQLFGLGVNSATGNGTLYQIDPQTGVATVVGAVGGVSLTENLPPATAGYGFDFNPTVDRIRVVTGTGLNFRINPNTGTVVATDPTITGGATAAAYTNSFNGAAITTLYTLNSTNNTLSIQNPPNSGTQTMTVPVTLNGAPLNFSAINGFDIAPGVVVTAANGPAVGFGVAVLTVDGVTNSYSINLSTGAATLITSAQPDAGFTIGDAPAGAIGFTFPPGSSTRFVAGSLATINLVRTDGSRGPVTVNVTQIGGTAVAGTDYTGLPSSVTFADGQTTATITFSIPTLAGQGTSGRTLVLGLSSPTNGAVLAAGSTANLTIAAKVLPTPQFAVGQDTGGSTVTQYNPNGTVKNSVTPFGSFTGGIRTAVGDVNGDGVPDLIVGTGPGIANRVRVLDGNTLVEITAFSPFESSFTGGVFVAVGDITGDGIADIIVTPDQSGGPRVVIYQGGTFNQIASFFGIEDPNFRGGARAAVSDVNGDGFGDVIVAAGFGGGPRVAVFNGLTIGGATAPVRLLPDFFAFEETLRNGVYVAGGDINDDGFGDIVTGGGPGGGPRVQIISGLVALNTGAVNVVPTPTPANLVLANFFAGDPTNRGGIRVTGHTLDADGFVDLITGSGEGAGSRVTAYLGSNLATGNTSQFFAFDAYPGFTGGVYVG